MYDNNIDTLYSPIYSYYYDENHYFKDTYFVASVLKIDNRKFEVTKSSVLVDSVRKMNEGTYKISEMYMHHYTYLKNSFSVKINNSVASTTDDSYVTISMKKIRDYLMSWSEGDEALVFANDVINGGIILIKIKLLNKLNSMKLIDYFNSNQNRNMIDKWLHYFDIYERHFSSFVGKKIKVLEIGIWQGGSLKMWKEYFGDQAEIIGVDIEPRCKKFEEERIKIYIGDQADTNFLHELIKSEGKFDIIIDDGGHYMHQQIISFQELYGALNDGGVYLCEDLHTNYWARYNGGYKKSLTFIEYTKNLIDELHSFYSEAPELKVTEFTKNTTGIHFYDSVVVFDRQKREKSTANNIGIKTIN
jgi:SAM-dependent methyltransferase